MMILYLPSICVPLPRDPPSLFLSLSLSLPWSLHWGQGRQQCHEVQDRGAMEERWTDPVFGEGWNWHTHSLQHTGKCMDQFTLLPCILSLNNFSRYCFFLSLYYKWDYTNVKLMLVVTLLTYCHTHTIAHTHSRYAHSYTHSLSLSLSFSLPSSLPPSQVAYACHRFDGSNEAVFLQAAFTCCPWLPDSTQQDADSQQQAQTQVPESCTKLYKH